MVKPLARRLRKPEPEQAECGQVLPRGVRQRCGGDRLGPGSSVVRGQLADGDRLDRRDQVPLLRGLHEVHRRAPRYGVVD